MDNKPNVEVIVVAWLADLLGGDWPVSGDKPLKPPIQFVLVDRIGGPREAMVLDRASILIEVYHKNSRATASDIANLIADDVRSLAIFAESVTGATVNSLVNLDDIIMQYSRYQLYIDVNNRR